MKEHFLRSKLSAHSHYNTASDSFQGFVFRADGDCVRIREVFWDSKNKKMMSSCQRVVFCPPPDAIASKGLLARSEWYFTADGVMGYSLEYGRRIYRSLKNHYEYFPDDIQKVYDKEAILEYAL